MIFWGPNELVFFWGYRDTDQMLLRTDARDGRLEALDRITLAIRRKPDPELPMPLPAEMINLLVATLKWASCKSMETSGYVARKICGQIIHLVPCYNDLKQLIQPLERKC